MIEEGDQQKLDEAAVQFVNEKLQYLRDELAPQLTEIISSNQNADDFAAEVTEKLEQLAKEVDNWFFKHQDQFEEIAPNLVFKMGFFDYLMYYSPVATLLRQTEFKIWKWRDHKKIRDSLVLDYSWEDKTGEIPRVLSMLYCKFPTRFTHLDPNRLIWQWEYSEVQARYLLGLIEQLYDQGIDISEQIYKDVILCTSAALMDDEGLDACMWMLRRWNKWGFTQKKKIKKGLIVSAWVNVAAYGEFFHQLSERLESWDKELLKATIELNDLVELGNFHIELLGKDDFQRFVKNDLKKYSPQDLHGYEPRYLDKLSLHACLAIDEDEETQTKLVNELIKAFDFKDGLSHELMITIKAVFCYDKKQLFDKYLGSILAKSNFDSCNIQPLFEIPSDAFSKKSKTKSKKKNYSYLLDLISKNKKLEKSLETNAPFKAIILAKSEGQEALVKHLIENAGTIKDFVSYFDQIDGRWSLDNAAIGVISSFIPKELLSAFLSLADRDKIVWFEWAARKSVDESISKPTDSYTLPFKLFFNIYLSVMKSEVNSIHRYLASYIGLSRLNLLKLTRTYSRQTSIENLNEIAGQVTDSSKAEVSNSVLLWLNKIGNFPWQFKNPKSLVSCEMFTAEQQTKLYSIIANNYPSYEALAISELISNGHDQILEQLIQKQYVRGNSTIAAALISASSEQTTNELKSLTRETLIAWIKKIDATSDPTLARAMSQFFGNGNLIPKDTKNQKKFLSIASELGHAQSSFELAKFEKTNSQDWDQTILAKAVDQGSIFAISDLAFCLWSSESNQTTIDFISSNLEKFEKGFRKQSLHKSWRFLLFACYTSCLGGLNRHEEVWTNCLIAFEFNTEAYLEDGHTFLENIWLESILSAEGFFDNKHCNVNLSSLVKNSIRALVEKQSSTEDKIKCLDLMDYYLDEKQYRQFSLNSFDYYFYIDYCQLCHDLEAYSRFVFRPNIFEHMDPETRKSCFCSPLSVLSKMHESNKWTKQLEQALTKNPDVLEDSKNLFWLSFYFEKNDPVRSFKYMEKSCQITPDKGNYNLLGIKYLNGEGVPKNTVQALAHFSVAKAMGHESADGWIENCSKNATKTQLSHAEDLAAKLWEKLQDKI